MSEDEKRSSATLNSPNKIAAEAERIYNKKFRDRFEEAHKGQFVVIDVQDGQAYLGKFAEDALQDAREKAPYGIFHLIRIGALTSSKNSYVGNHGDAWDWSLRRAG